MNVAINTPSKNALIEAFGDDTKDWVGKVVTGVTEKAIIAGKRSIILYFVPEGFELKETDDGFMTISRGDIQVAPSKVTKTVREEVAGEDDREAPLPEDDF